MPGQEPESDPVLKLRPRELFWRRHLEGILEATGPQGLEPFIGFRRPNSWWGEN